MSVIPFPVGSYSLRHLKPSSCYTVYACRFNFKMYAFCSHNLSVYSIWFLQYILHSQICISKRMHRGQITMYCEKCPDMLPVPSQNYLIGLISWQMSCTRDLTALHFDWLAVFTILRLSVKHFRGRLDAADWKHRVRVDTWNWYVVQKSWKGCVS